MRGDYNNKEIKKRKKKGKKKATKFNRFCWEDVRKKSNRKETIIKR